MSREFFNKNFLTGNVTLYADVQVSRLIRLHGEYAYYNTLFFVSNYASLGMTIHFWNDKKK
jgi:hypothetical protein